MYPEEIDEMGEERRNVSAVQMQLDEMHLLSLFPNVQTLILTGGMPEENDFSALYSQDQLRELILDYEETDSDEDGIKIDRFPHLEYVLSRSNLNIRSADMIKDNVEVEILNLYSNGKPEKISIPSAIEICRPQTGFVFSAETYGPASYLLVRLLNEIDSYLLENNCMISRYTDDLDSIGIIPVCMPQEMLNRWKERKYVSKKKRYADIRLHLDYMQFIKGVDNKNRDNKRREMCYENIKAAGEYISGKVPSFKLQQFLADIRTALGVCKEAPDSAAEDRSGLEETQG